MLPYWKSEEDIELSKELISRLAPFTKVAIGISSNKQDVLAELIQSVFPEKVIYCLGAAISTKRSYNSFDKFGLTWVLFMITSPVRAYMKIKITLMEFLKILFYEEDRNKFLTFINEGVVKDQLNW